MKKLFVRYFLNRNDAIPRDSQLVCGDKMGRRYTMDKIAEHNDNMMEWMVQHPEGKVDLVWL